MTGRAAALLLLAALAGATARAYPVPRAAHERWIHAEPPQLAIGPWRAAEDGLGLDDTSGAAPLVLLAAGGTSFVRAELRGLRDTWVALLFRAQVIAPRPLRLRGYGLAVDPRNQRVEFLRWDEGGVRHSDAAVEVAGLADLDALEVCLWHSGASFIAQLVALDSRRPLATLSWSDPAYADGAVGLQLAGRAAPRLRARLAVAPVATVAADSAVAERPWLAREWLVVVSPEVAPALADLGPALRPLPSVEPTERAFATDEPTVFALRQRGTPLLTAQAGVPFKYRDPGYTARRQAVLAPGRRGRVLVEGLKDEALIAAQLEQLAARFPDRCRREELGQSVEGRPLVALRLADQLDDTTRPVVLLVAGHHADEVITPELVLDAVALLLDPAADPRVRRWLSAFTIIAVPLVNPDGSHAFWHRSDQLGRTNRRPAASGELGGGVDLNRNYPFLWGEAETRFDHAVPESPFYRGPAPGSEPETQAMMRLGERERPLALISYHAAATKLLVPYTSGEQLDPEPSLPWLLAAELLAALPHAFRGRRYEAVRNLYPVTGTDQDWFFHRFGTVAYLLEAPVLAPVRLGPLREAVQHSRGAWQALLDRWLAGPSLSVQTVDRATGAPLSAEITVDAVTLRAGERWSSRPDNGWLHQYLPGPGRTVVRARLGDRQAEAELSITGGHHRLTLAL